MNKIFILFILILFGANFSFASIGNDEIRNILLNSGYENDIVKKYLGLINEKNINAVNERLNKKHFNLYFEYNLLKLKNEGKDYYKKYDDFISKDDSVEYTGFFDLSDSKISQDRFISNLKFYREIFLDSKYNSWLDSDIKHIIENNNYNVIYFPYRDTIMKYYFANSAKDIFKTKEYYELGSFLVGKIDSKNFKFYKNMLLNSNTNYSDLLYLSNSICPTNGIDSDKINEAFDLGCFSPENYERPVDFNGQPTCDTCSNLVINKVKKCILKKTLSKNEIVDDDLIDRIAFTDISTKKVQKLVSKNLANNQISQEEKTNSILYDIEKAQNQKEKTDNIKKIPSSIAEGLAGGLGILIFPPAAMFLDGGILEGLSPGDSQKTKTFNQKISNGIMHIGLVNPLSLAFYFIGR